MKYYLKKLESGSHPSIEIKKENYESLKVSKIILSEALAFEEKYEMLISNYLELEKEVLSLTAESMVIKNTNYSRFFDYRVTLNRRLVNLLTSTKLYIDQIHRHINKCFLNEYDVKEEIKELFSSEYDSSFEYRFMEALRNFVQHYGLAVHSTYNKKRFVPPSNSNIEFNFSFYTHKSELANGNKFKKLVYDEMPEKVELISATRIYIGALSRIHYKIRLYIEKNISEARRLFEYTIKKYETDNNTDSTALYAIMYTPSEPNDKIEEQIPILLDWDDIRIELEKKNIGISNLGKMFVSSECL